MDTDIHISWPACRTPLIVHRAQKSMRWQKQLANSRSWQCGHEWHARGTHELSEAGVHVDSREIMTNSRTQLGHLKLTHIYADERLTKCRTHLQAHRNVVIGRKRETEVMLARQQPRKDREKYNTAVAQRIHRKKLYPPASPKREWSSLVYTQRLMYRVRRKTTQHTVCKLWKSKD